MNINKKTISRVSIVNAILLLFTSILREIRILKPFSPLFQATLLVGLALGFFSSFYFFVDRRNRTVFDYLSYGFVLTLFISSALSPSWRLSSLKEGGYSVFYITLLTGIAFVLWDFKNNDKIFLMILTILSAFRYQDHIGRGSMSMANRQQSNNVFYTKCDNLLDKHRVQEYKLPVEFIGKINQDEVFSYYEKSCLLFASQFESFGLPLLEARLHYAPIIAADQPYANDILDGYENALLFDLDSVESLVLAMKKIIDQYVVLEKSYEF